MADTQEALPTEITVGGRTYEILSLHEENEKFVVVHAMVERAKKLRAHNDEKERKHLLADQHEIHVLCQDEVFLFTDDQPDNPEYAYHIHCIRCRRGPGWATWSTNRIWLDVELSDRYKVLRRIT